jgi:xanthine dehydrogenase YagR molybdenum-binding subunit
MSVAPFPDRERIDARDKVRGAMAYAADVAVTNLLYAMTVPARIAKGTITVLRTDAALRVPGVVRVLTPDDFPHPSPTGGGPPRPPTLETRIAYRGQPLALVVAETLEAAVEGAEAVDADYAAEPFSPLIDSAGSVRQAVEEVKAGDADGAMANAAFVHEAEYVSPAQHHNTIEMLSTTAVWANGRLTIYEGTQHSGGVKGGVALALGLDPAIVDVKSPTVGGGFGQKGGVQRQTALVARAAILTGRPVKLVMPRGQIFHNATFRPKSRHRIRLGVDGSGRMVAVRYHADHQQSRQGQFPPNYHDAPIQLYGIADYLGTAANIRIDTQAPGYMRAPHPHPACFAFESAVDELAFKLSRDPVAFRLAHDTRTDPLTGKPMSSHFLHECIREGARRFGWERRVANPGTMRATDGSQIGWGVGCGAYPCMMTPAVASLRIGANGSTRFAISGHEMGQGIRTAIAAVLTEGLGIGPERLEIVIGDTTAAPQHMTAGSWGTASVVPAATQAIERMRAAVSELVGDRLSGGTLHQQIAAARRPFLEVGVAQLAPGQDVSAIKQMERIGYAVAGPAYPEFTAFSYVAHFVEVRIEPQTRRIRVPRVVSVADCGRVVSPRTAASQLRGGVVWAIGAVLREATEVDPRFGGWLNNDLADYVVPVNADIGEIDVGFVGQPDPLTNSIGTKGLGEVAMVGAAAAVANAIFHATGKRLREMPIRIDHLLAAEA